MQYLKTHKQENKKENALFVNTPVLIALVKMSRFFLFLFFSVFGISSFFSRDVFDRLPKIKKNIQNTKATTRKKMQSKRKSQNKSRQQAETRQTKEHLETKSNKTKTKSKNQKLKRETEFECTLNQKH